MLRKILKNDIRNNNRHCEFQDLNSRMMIDSARLIDSLYYFDDNRFENKQA